MTALTRTCTMEIAAPPERVWQAITDGTITPSYYFGTRVESSWVPGVKMTYHNAEGGTEIDGDVVEVDPPRRLVTTLRAMWPPESAADAPTRVSWTLEPVASGTRLTLTHTGFEGETATYKQVTSGCEMVLEAMKV